MFHVKHRGGENMNEHYDGSKLLSILDINGKKPSIYISATNRSAGKTTFFNRLLVNNFLKNGTEFMLFYRYKKELYEVSTKFFGEIGRLFFKNHTMREDGGKDRPYKTLILDDNVCGYAVALNSAEEIKKCSHVFSRVYNTLLDEFQSESNKYLTDEVQKYISIQNSIARGGGKHIRITRNFLVGNHITLLNPYYVALGLHKKLTAKNIYTRGDGYVAETNFIDSVAKKSTELPFNRAFSACDYITNISDKCYLNDNNDYICKLTNVKRYICTMVGKDCQLGVWDCDGKKVISEKYDNSHPIVCAKYNTPILSAKIKSDGIYENLRNTFNYGMLYFDGLYAKNKAIEILGY